MALHPPVLDHVPFVSVKHLIHTTTLCGSVGLSVLLLRQQTQ